ncbi:MAG: HIT family protein [Spirochaetota bacterium]
MATLFSKIVTGEIPSVKLHEDDHCVVILDLSPINKGHALVISKQEYETIIDCPEAELGHLICVARTAAQRMQQVLNMDGFNIMINNGSASGQEIPHLHIHIIPRYQGDGKTPIMQKDAYDTGEMDRYGELLSF